MLKDLGSRPVLISLLAFVWGFAGALLALTLFGGQIAGAEGPGGAPGPAGAPGPRGPSGPSGAPAQPPKDVLGQTIDIVELAERVDRLESPCLYGDEIQVVTDVHWIGSNSFLPLQVLKQPICMP